MRVMCASHSDKKTAAPGAERAVTGTFYRIAFWALCQPEQNTSLVTKWELLINKQPKLKLMDQKNSLGKHSTS